MSDLDDPTTTILIVMAVAIGVIIFAFGMILIYAKYRPDAGPNPLFEPHQ